MSANDNAEIIPAQQPQPSVEAWSGKDKQDENFPVGSWLIRRGLRAHVHAFYAFARNADDIADNAALEPAEKIARLDRMEAVLMGADDPAAPSATRLRASIAVTGVPSIHARELLVAFRQDARKNRYADWADLMDYCRYSAAPVGRYVLDLHGEDPQTWPASDALCASLQVLNHMQDCAGDLRALDRCYMPQDWMAQAGTSADDLARGETPPAMRAVFDKMLAATVGLNLAAAPLPALVQARRLRVETAIITRLARRLTALLQNGDPLAGRVKLRKADFIAASLFSIGRIL